MSRLTPYPVPRKPSTDPAGRDKYEQAARASWIAPLIAFGIGIFMNSIPSKDYSVAIVRLILDIIMIGGGLVAAIYALTGVRKRGPVGVLVPAVVGLIINGALLLLGLGLVAYLGSGSKKLPPSLQGMSMQQIGGKSFRQAGWFGATNHQGAVVTATSLAPSTPMGQLVGSETQGIGHMVLISIDNAAGRSTMNVDCSSVTILMAGGKRLKAMSLSDAAAGDKGLRDGMKRFSGIRQVPAGRQLVDGIGFFASNPALETATGVTVTIDGATLQIPGQFYSEQEKAKLIPK